MEKYEKTNVLLKDEELEAITVGTKIRNPKEIFNLPYRHGAKRFFPLWKTPKTFAL